MRHESKKIAQIVDELLTMLLLCGNGNIEVTINRYGQGTEIVIRQHQCCYDEQFVKKLRHNLKARRLAEVEGCYWELVGDVDNGEELSLVGVMIDESVVELDNRDLYIRLVRRN